MNRLFCLVAASALLALVSPSAAPAVPITSTADTGSGLHLCLSEAAAPCDGGLLPAGTQEFTLDFSGSGFVADSLISSAQLVLELADDGGSSDGPEKIALLLDNVPFVYTDNANHNAVITLSNLGALLDGRLVVSLGAGSGDFFFERAHLAVVSDPAFTADGSPVAAAVPAPATLMMLGAGMIIAVAWKRRTVR